MTTIEQITSGWRSAAIAWDEENRVTNRTDGDHLSASGLARLRCENTGRFTAFGASTDVDGPA